LNSTNPLQSPATTDFLQLPPELPDTTPATDLRIAT
jgi:hypothetical protein